MRITTETVMHPPLLQRVCAIALSACAFAFAPLEVVEAAKKNDKAAPQITAFEMEPAERLATGNELFFRVQGTPGSRVTVRVGGVARTLVLHEVDDGVYEGAYTLRPSDQAGPNSAAT